MKKLPPPMENKAWCVTAVNRLTGKREMVTSPCTLKTALAIHKKEMNKKSSERAFTHPKVSRYSYYMDHPEVELSIDFNEQ